MSRKETGVKAHKEYLETLRTQMKILNEKFENGTLQNFEVDRRYILTQEIRQLEQELKGVL